MSKNLRERAESTAHEVQQILGHSDDDHPKEIADAIEQAIIRALVNERNRCADVALSCLPANDKNARKIAEEIRQVRSVLIANLSGMR